MTYHNMSPMSLQVSGTPPEGQGHVGGGGVGVTWGLREGMGGRLAGLPEMGCTRHIL